MPEYLYIDENDHTQTVTERMLYGTGHVCAACGLRMWRKPQSFIVNWGGLKPSDGDLDPKVRHLVDTRDERRQAFEGVHEEHERNN